MSGSNHDNSEETLHPLKIFYEGDEQNEQSRRSRGRGMHSRGRSRGRSQREQSHDSTENLDASTDTTRSTRGRGRGGRGIYRPSSRGRSQREQSHDSAENLDASTDTTRSTRGRGRGGRGIYRPPSRDRRNVPSEKNAADETVGKIRPPPVFTIDKLIRFSKRKDIDEVLLDIGHSKSGFADLLQKKPDPNLVQHLVKLLSNVSESTKVHNRRELLQIVETSFLHNLTEILNEVGMKEESTRNIWNCEQNFSIFLKNILQLLTAIMTTLPSSLAKCKGVIRAIMEVQDVFDNINIQQELDDVEKVLQRERQAKQASRDTLSTGSFTDSKQRSAGQFVPKQPSEPPDNFRNISIFPTLADFHIMNKPFLRANRIEGEYDSLDTYLDVQFRLLREDYIQPLRKGILEYKSCIKENIPVKKLRDIRLYHAVQILRPICSGNGINYILQFDIKYLKHINWAASRRLLYGSLLCLSKDNFETMFFAIVTERNEKELKDGNIRVRFENMCNGFDIGQNDEFVMVETSAYFEAYRYILEGLLEIKDTIPFQRYLVDCKDTILPPKYLLGKAPHYDFSCLLEDTDESFPPIPVLNTLRWPTCQDIGLDRTQYEAIKRAITKELAIIQGPPGTGKTYVGLKITRLLLNNSQFWSTGVKAPPILVVCYTNHALDQFLEAILDSCDGKVVRIGGRCKSERLEPFILRNIKTQRKENRERSFRLMQKERDCINTLKACERKIGEVSAKIKKTTTSIISFDELEEFMTENQRYGLKLVASNDYGPNLSKWLGFTDDSSEVSIEKIWEQEIIASIEAIPRQEKNDIIEPWSLDLRRRAELYKSWVLEFTENVQAKIDNSSDSVNSNYLKSLVNRAQENILDVEVLLKFTTSLSTKLQIQMLFAGKVHSLQNLIQVWLELTGRKTTVPVIKEILETMMDSNDVLKNHTNEGDDLEEDRELDEDDFLFDFESKVDKNSRVKIKKSGYGWITEWNKRKIENKVKAILSMTKQIDSREAENLGNVLHLHETGRMELYAYWVKRYRAKLRETVTLFEKKFDESTEKIMEVRDMETVEILNEAGIVGMTTTGAAKYRKLLQNVCPKIIIVEEAAEVLESHIVTTLNDNCQHLILIGDHKQLKPSTAVYDLSNKYQMDVSLFERMVLNKIPFVTLEEQHRMRPDISTLLKHPDLYPQLRDHTSVSKYESIKGIDFDVQFIDHDEIEVTAAESTSYSNPHEAKFIASLCQYIMNQGYNPDQITVITPYMGQVFLLRREMPKTIFEGVRITAIDNYQGEENDIILLSLVRSNPLENQYGKKSRIGFVGIENRICVSLSRAKKGLYVIGNFKLLAECSQMWADMIRDMREKGRVLEVLTLRCQNHPDQFIQAKSYKDFQKVPSGGCMKSCNAKLSCGHICPKYCHVIDREHLQATCTMRCERIVCDGGHQCTLKCWQPCGLCKTTVEKILPLCQHKAKMPCHMDVYVWKCHVKCNYILPCGHRCNKDCYKCLEDGFHEQECKKEVEKMLKCRHPAKMMCHKDVMDYQCKIPCAAILDCMHKCTGKCGSCFGGRIHQGCKGACKKVLPCGHECSFPCSEICPPCTQQCGSVCSHGYPCKKKCWEKCDYNCHLPCAFRCPHQKCEHDCTEHCPNKACDEPCLKKLKCGHDCNGLCGEVCICTKCNLEYVRHETLKKFDESTHFIQIPECSCIIEVTRLDQHMFNTSLPRRSAICKRCPHCSKPIRKNIRRYSNILKQTRSKVAEKFMVLVGSDKERKDRMRLLREELQNLELNGLVDTEKNLLLAQLSRPNNYDTLHTTKMKIERLKLLLKITNDVEKAKMAGVSFIPDMRSIVIEPDKFRKLIVTGKKFATNQFWKEIDIEIQRLSLCLRTYERKHFVKLNTALDTKVDDMLQKAFQVLELRDLNAKRIGALQSTMHVLRDISPESRLDPRVISIHILILENAFEQEDIRSERNTGSGIQAKENIVGQKIKKPVVRCYDNSSDEYRESLETSSDSADSYITTTFDQRPYNGTAKITTRGITQKDVMSSGTNETKTDLKDDRQDLDPEKHVLSL